MGTNTVPVVVILAAVGVAVAGVRQTPDRKTATDQVACVGQALKRIETIKPGMTRQQLLTVFTTEGGLSTPLKPTFVARECPYLKAEVEFKAVGRPDRGSEVRIATVEDSRDVIARIPRPYLQEPVFD